MNIRISTSFLSRKLWAAVLAAPLLPDVAGATEPEVQPAGGTIRPFQKKPVTTTVPCIPCPPCPLPAQPGAAPGMEQPQPPAPGVAQPQPPQPAPAAAPDFGDRSASAGADVGSVVGLRSPNLFGDFLGGRASQVVLARPAMRVTGPGILNGQTLVLSVRPTVETATVTSNPNPPPATITQRTVSGNLQSAVLNLRNTAGQTTPLLGGQPIGVNSAVRETFPALNQPFPPANATTINGILQYLAVPPGTAIPTPPGVPVPAGTIFQQAAAFEQAVNPQAVLTRFQLGGVQALYTGSELQYLSQITSTISTAGGGGGAVPLFVSVPNPGSGGVVGLIKISEDNNPLPRDRVIFNYDYFSNTALAPGGIPVNRYQFGFEKTFFNGRTSFEFRAPFAGTVNSDGVAGQQVSGTEFGNVRLAVKGLLYSGNVVNVSALLGVYLPTADGITLRAMDGSQLLRAENSSVQLAPYIAALVTPNDRLFAQAWLGMVFDTGGNAVQVNPMFFGGSSGIGSLRAGNLLTADIQIGYWLRQVDFGLIRGLAPFVELHYNGVVSNGSLLATRSGFLIGDVNGNLDELNISAGVISRLGENTNLSVGAAAPLRTGQNRTFDYQIGVRLNYFFGYTARQQNRATRVSSF